ncbi:MAG: hypothetical protein NTY22_08080, partial [Proteobacteria bacterium]|nr:hypothetical protein [Pseudomonadota bacterium]
YLPKVERYYREQRGRIISDGTISNSLSAYEKEVMIKSETAKYREMRDMLLSMAKFLDGRRTFVQSLLKSGDDRNKMEE